MKRDGVSLRTLNKVLIISALFVSVVLVYSTYQSASEYRKLANGENEYIELEKAATDLMDASDYLTEMVQRFTLAGEREYMDNYFEEADVTQRREKAIETMAPVEHERDALRELWRALDESISLMDREYYAMRLVIEATGLTSYPSRLDSITLTEADAALAPEAKMARAREMVLGTEYYDQKNLIRAHMKESVAQLEETALADQEEAVDELGESLRVVRIVIACQMLLVILMIWLTSRLGINPVLQAVEHINEDDPIPVIGANEFRYLARTYNRMYSMYKTSLDRLNFKANHDELTRAYNRAGYDLILSALDISSTYMVLFDLDDFKTINDTHGHEVGDLALKRVVKVVMANFRGDDYICRIGGDEFVVFMVHVSEDHRWLLETKMKLINYQLQNDEGEVPGFTISAGVAHGSQVSNAEEWFRAADEALYETKRAGKQGVTFYEG